MPVIGLSWGMAPVQGSLLAAVTQIRSAGGKPVVLREFTPHTDVAVTLTGLDGLVVMGNDFDIDPALYGQANHPATQVDTDISRAQFEEAAIALALESGMPLLGICGGMQRLNIHNHAENGGTLHQHVPDVVAGGECHRQGERPPYEAAHGLRIIPGSRLAEIAAGETTLFENSLHHQAVHVAHREFFASAHADDGLIEAIEPRPESRYGKQFALGVQWHPEFGASPLGARIAGALIEEARLYALKRRAFSQQKNSKG